MKPILFEGMLFGMPLLVTAYSLFNGLALVTMTIFGARVLRKHQKTWMQILALALVMVVGFLVGARLYYGGVHFQQVLKAPSLLWELKLINFGLYGGLASSLAILWFWCRRNKVSFLGLIDQGVPWLALALALSKLGCFFNGCCYGLPTDLPWAMYFARAQGGALGWLSPTFLGKVLSGSGPVLRHPTQVYEVAVFIGAALIVCGLKQLPAAKIRRLGPWLKIEGLSGLLYLFLITVGRWGIYPLRDYPSVPGEVQNLVSMIRGPLTYGIILLGLFLAMYILVVKFEKRA